MKEVRLTSEDLCADRLYKKLFGLFDKKVIHNAFKPGTNEFEVLEFYGDSYLYERVSHFLMTTRRFMDPHLMTTVRVACIRNSNLAEVYDLLRLASLCPPSLSTTIHKELIKWKGDVIEAIIGELAEAEENQEANMLLTELLAFIAYCGEKAYFEEKAVQKVNGTTKHLTDSDSPSSNGTESKVTSPRPKASSDNTKR